MKVIRTALLCALALTFCASAHCTVYVNRNYYWNQYSQQYEYNIVDRSYDSANPGYWGASSDFGMNGSGPAYVLEANVYVQEGGSLTVEPGVSVSIAGGIYVAGTLNAQGTAGNHITFTGGGGPRSWDEILIYGAGASGSVLRYCDISNGGAGRYIGTGWIGYHYSDGSIRVHSSAPTIEHCTITAAKWGIEGTGACQATITDSTFSDCDYGIVCYDSSYYDLPVGSPPIRGNTFTGNAHATHCSAQAAGAIDSSNTVTGNTYNVCQVYESTVQNSPTWHALQGTPCWQILGDVTVPAGTSLTVQPGAVVKFNPSVSLCCTGTLTANGTSADRIHFTSIKDDLVGGDSNGDGVSFGANGDWAEILLAYETSSGSSLSNCTVSYGGNDRYYPGSIYYHYASGTVSCHSSSPAFADCTISNAGNVGLLMVGVCNPTITNVSFQGNGAWAAYCTDVNSNPVIANSSATSNARNVVSFPGGDMVGNHTWYRSVPYHFRGSPRLMEGASLVVEAGTAVKMDPGVGLYVRGNLQAIGTPSQPIYFTAYTDDVYGDSNADGDASVPSPGYWREMLFYGAEASASRMENCTVRYAGSGAYNGDGYGYHYAYGTLAVVDCSPRFVDCAFDRSGNYAFWCYGTCDPILATCEFSNSNWGLVSDNACFFSQGSPLVTGCSFTGNATAMYCSAQALSNFAADNTFTGNTSNMVYIYSSEVQSASNWRLMQGHPVIGIYGNVGVPEGKSLSIEAGNVVKLRNSSIYAAGTVTAGSSSGGKTYITSFRDDSVGGDTDVDSGASAPAGADWDSLFFVGAGASASSFTNCEIRYGGSGRYMPAWYYGYINHDGAVMTINSDPTFQDTTFDSAGGYATRLLGSSHPMLTNVDFRRAGSFPVWQAIGSNATISNCSASENGANAIYLEGGWISDSRTWCKSIPYYVSGDITVGSAVQLTLQPGTVVKVGDGVGFYSNGNLQAVGTEQDRIAFTSWHDDELGGDSNANSSGSAPSAGNWKELELWGATSSPSHLKNCIIRYGGNGNYQGGGHGYHTAYGTLMVYDSAATIEDCEISGSGSIGFWAAANCDATITRCDIHGNSYWGIYLEDAYRSVSSPLKVSGNDIYGNGYAGGYSLPTASLSIAADNSVHDNVRNWIEIGSGDFNVSGTWHNISDGACPFYVQGGANVLGGVTLDVEPGTVVKFGGDCRLAVNGTLNAIGTEENRITFTSSSDDTVAGDSNGDGAGSAPSPGFWREVVFGGGAGASRLAYCTFRYGGNGVYSDSGTGYHYAWGNVYLGGVSPSFDHCDFSFSGDSGLICYPGSPTIDNCTFAANAYEGLYLRAGSVPTVNSSLFSGNGRWAVYQPTNEGAGLNAAYCDFGNPVHYAYWTNRPDNPSYWFWAWADTVHPGANNFSADPLFVNAAAGDFTLQPASPCINAGDPSKTDPNGSRIDVGAYAFNGLWNPMDIGLAKGSPDGTEVLIVGKVVTGGASELGGMIYIEDESRVSGIRIDSSVASAQGDSINVSGTLATADGERVIADAAVSVISNGNPVPMPLFMVARSVGGGPLGRHIPGVPGTCGLNNTGILIATSGTVTAIDTGCFWLDDGSGIAAEGGRMGIKVVSSAAVTQGQACRVVGVSSTYTDGEFVRSVIRTRSEADVRPLN